MTMKTHGGGMSIGRHGEVGYNELRENVEGKMEDNDRLHELGEKYVEDKKKLEDAIEQIQSSNIAGEDKQRMIDELKTAIDALEGQYKEEVEDPEAGVRDEIEDLLDQMGQTIDEFTKQTDSLRGVKMEAASIDANSAADAGDTKKQEFEQMKAEYVEKLRLQMQQADIQQRNIRARRLRG